MTRLMVCGVDCRPGDAHCNGYCQGKAERPPAATPAQVEADALKLATQLLNDARRAWYDYYGMCEVGPERVRAAEVYARLMRIHYP